MLGRPQGEPTTWELLGFFGDGMEGRHVFFFKEIQG